jgi:hypothetical protein
LEIKKDSGRLGHPPGFITGEGWGNSRAEAVNAAQKNANENLKKLGTGIYKRHCDFKCEQQ